jgi:hypothetical protein
MADMDYRKLAEEKRKNWQELYDRMENDCSLIDLETWVLKDVNGQTIPNATSITLNDIAVFVDKVEAALGGSDEQVTVESEDKGLDTDYIEDFLTNTFEFTDDLLSMRGELVLNSYIDQMVCRKGRAAARVILQWDTDRIVPEIVNLDVGYLVYGMDKQGLGWHSYKVERDIDSILAEYPEVTFDKEAKEYEVEDIWTRDKNEVWVANQLVLTQTHNWGSVPVCVQVVPKGSIGDIKYQGESLLYLIRDLVPALNELASEIKTLNSRAVDWALQYKVSKETYPTGETPDHDKITNPGAVTQVPSDGGFELMPLGELRQQAWLLHQMIETRIQRGGVSNFDMGTFTQPMSAVALVQVGEGRDQTFLPRLGTRGLLKRQISKQMINRTIQIANELGKSSIKVGEYDYDVSKLKGKFTVDFDYFTKSPAVDIARYEVANSAGNLVSDYTKRREIIHLQDPDGEERLIRTQEAELLSPNIKKYRTVKALLEEAEKGDDDAQLEAEILVKELGLSLEQVMSGDLSAMPPVASPDTSGGTPRKSLVDLMGTETPARLPSASSVRGTE